MIGKQFNLKETLIMISYFLDEEARYVASKIMLFTITVMIITTVAWHTISHGAFSGGMVLAALIVGLLVSIPTALTSVTCMSRERSAGVPTGIALIISYTLLFIAMSLITGNKLWLDSNDFIYMGVTAVAVSIFANFYQTRIEA